MENQAVALAPEKKASLFSIKPYGDNLCTPGARYWISCIRLVIVVMALSEAIAWAYLGSLFGKGMVGYVAAAIAFLFVFIIIWIIDVSFVTLDMSKAHYDNEILKKKTSSFWDNLKISIGLLGRVAIVVVSLSISAPFIAQIVFMQDIDNEMEGQNLARVAVVSDSLLAQKDAEVAALDSLILEKEQELVVETAGRGESGNYGFGPVTQAMERNIQRLKDERDEQIASKEEMQETFASLSIEEFAQRYNVDLVDNGVQARSAILTSLSQNPEYRTAKRAITAFLAFIFAALVLLKLFQPRSVRIYYNEKLQDLYKEYLSGNLNRWISKEEQLLEDGRSQISPLRFEDWSINTYGVIRSEDIKRRESSKMYNSFKLKIEQLENEKDEVKKMLDPIEQEYDQLVTELNGMRIELMKANNDVEQNDRIADDITRQLESIHTDLRNGSFKGQDLIHAVQAKKSTEDRLAQHAEARMQLKHDQDIANHRYDIKKEEVDQVEELMSKVRANYRYIQEKIDEERLKYTELIVSGQILGNGHAERSATYDEQIAETNLIAEKEQETKEPAGALPAAATGFAVGTATTAAAAANAASEGENEEDVDEDAVGEDAVVADEFGEEEAYESDFYEPEDAEVTNTEEVSYHEEPVSEDEAEYDYESENEEVDTRDQDPFYHGDPYGDRYDDASYEDLYDDMYDQEENTGPDDESEDEVFDQENEAIKADQEMINRFIWEDEDERREENERDQQDITDEQEEEEVEEPEESSLEKPYQHYPLLINGMEKEKDEESPIEYVDDEKLERYADSVSLAAYEDDEDDDYDISKKHSENNSQNEEGKSDNSIEVFSPDLRQDEPEEMDAEAAESYSEERPSEPSFSLDDTEKETTDSSEENEPTKRTTYAWNALESTYPDQREIERDEIVEEGAEEKDQPADIADSREAEAFEDIPGNDESEAPNTRARDPQPRRKVVMKRRLGRTGDWMIG